VTGERSVLVIGAQGGAGAATARAFEQAGWRVRRAGRRPEPGVERLDLDDGEADAMREPASVVVNCVPHDGLVPERAVLEGGGVLIRIPEAPAGLKARLRDDVPQRGLVVLNAGIFPGVASLAAVDLLTANPEAETVVMALTLSASGTSGRGGGATLHRWISTRRRHAVDVVPFPVPFGARRCFRFAEDDDGCIGEHVGQREVRTAACFVERGLNGAFLALNRAGLLSRIPRVALTAKPADTDRLSREPFAVWVGALKAGTVLGATTITGEGDYRCTGASTVVLAERLMAGAGSQPGCRDAAALFALDDLLAPLRAAGVDVRRS
jgi:NAD(P)-dependent dehydrogenase (short-subunit alcohol dehydrogenase family)